MDDRTSQLLTEFLALSRAELDRDQADAIEAELTALPEGGRLIRESREFDDQLSREMRDVPVPTDLKGRILDRLAERRGRVYRRRVWQAAALAASVLVAFTLGLGLISLSRPTLDAERIASEYEPALRDPFAQAEAWLEEQDLHFTPDLPIDTRLLAGYAMAEFQGKTVPMLEFVNYQAGAFARIYLVQSGQFDFRGITDKADGSFCSVQVIPDRDRPFEIAYVAIYNTPRIDPFLIQSGRPA